MGCCLVGRADAEIRFVYRKELEISTGNMKYENSEKYENVELKHGLEKM